MDGYKIAAYVPVGSEALEDRNWLHETLDRYARPWAYPDPPADLHVDPLPGLTRIGRGARIARARVRDVVYAARHGMPDNLRDDEDY